MYNILKMNKYILISVNIFNLIYIFIDLLKLKNNLIKK